MLEGAPQLLVLALRQQTLATAGLPEKSEKARLVTRLRPLQSLVTVVPLPESRSARLLMSGCWPAPSLGFPQRWLPILLAAAWQSTSLRRW